MNTAIDRSGVFVASQLGYMKSPESISTHHFGPAITISRQTGSGAHDIAEKVAELLQKSDVHDPRPWNVFDRQLVEKALEEHKLPARLAKYMPEDRRTYLDDFMDELFGLHPPSSVLVPEMVETVLHLLKEGHVIILGRGGVAAAAKMHGIFHVRLVASLAKRVERVCSILGLSAHDAEKYIQKSDLGAHRYVRMYFHASIEDDLLYHLVVNTDRIPYAAAATLIAREAEEYFKREELCQQICGR